MLDYRRRINVLWRNKVCIRRRKIYKYWEELFVWCTSLFAYIDGHPIFGEHGERINYPDNIIIDDHVWVGQRATILKGVSIGSNSMIGTMSLVTKSFGCNSMIAGVPAKMIKNGINWRFELYD